MRQCWQITTAHPHLTPTDKSAAMPQQQQHMHQCEDQQIKAVAEPCITDMWQAVRRFIQAALSAP